MAERRTALEDRLDACGQGSCFQGGATVDKPSLERGGFARLFYGRGSARLSLGKGSVDLEGDGSTTSIALEDLKARVRCETGLFWARLLLSTETGTRVLGGYPKQPAVSFTEEVNGRLRRYAERQLEKASAPLREVAERIAALLGGAAYARNSQRTAAVTAAESALAVTSHDFWEDFATQEQRMSAEAASDFVVNSKRLVRESNERFVKAELERYAEFFDTIESKPLTQAQRKACVISEDNNLVLAGAGTGKTSTMMGRAGYLLTSERVEPERLLMLAYGRKAAGEMQERQDSRLAPWLNGGGPKIKTFHALGLEVIGKAEGKRPDVSPMVEDPRAYEAFITSTIDQLCEKRAYRRRLIQYLGTAQFPYRSPFDFATILDYLEYVRTNELRTLTGQLVKSYEEIIVANFLTLSGIAYAYEAPYEVETAGPDYRQYRPDFFLTEHGIYIEHFALDENGNPPKSFGPARYLEGVAWKRALHEKHGTTLIETYSYEQHDGELEALLEQKLRDAEVKVDPRADEEILEDLRKMALVSDFGVLMGEFLNLFKQSGTTMGQLKASVAQHEDAKRLELLVELFTPVLDVYQSHLTAHDQIDFHDMINRATEHVRSGRYSSPFTHLMVDEFQDISAPRADLVKALREQRDDSVVFTVGDDWQAIYRFAGSDIGFTRDFKKHFGTTVTTALDTTFRFNDKIGQVSSAFVLQNPAQMNKTIGSLTESGGPAVSLLRVLEMARGLELSLGAVAERVRDKGSENRTSILVLARYNFEIAEWRAPAFKRTLAHDFPSLSVEFSTVHSAKGKEADYVIVVGLAEGKYGFPCEVPADEILELLLPADEDFLHAEERRLFYVALTRARHRVYLVYNPMGASAFIHELLDNRDVYPIVTDEFDDKDGVVAELPRVRCPSCESGFLVPREGPYGRFYGCSHFPRCKHVDKPCPLCGGMMRKTGRFKECVSSRCKGRVPICPKCGGAMVERAGPYGRFWGCSNYRGKDGDGGFTCTQTEQIRDA